MASPTDSVGRRLLLLGTASWSFAAAVIIPPPPTPTPQPAISDINLVPRTMYAMSASFPPAIVANPFAVGGRGAIAWSLASNPGSVFAIDASSGAVRLAVEQPAAGSYPITVRATDAATGQTFDKATTIPCVAGNGFYITTDWFADCEPANFIIGTALPGAPTASSGGTAQFLLDGGYYYIGNNGAASPLTAGATYQVPISVTIGGVVYAQTFSIRYLPAVPMINIVAAFATTSSAAPAGALVATLRASNPQNRYAWTLQDNEQGRFAISNGPGGTGLVTLVDENPAPGPHGFSATVTNGSSSFTQAFTFTVVAGQVLPSSAMTMTIASGLDNYVSGQAIGTPAVSGLSGSVIWTLFNIDAGQTSFDGYQALFSIDGATGAVVAPRQLPARPGGHDLVISASNGIDRCTRTFNVPVAAKVGPTCFVGRGMVAAHGAGVGFDHWTDVLVAIVNRGGGIPPAYAGAVFNIVHDADPDYFAEDNGSGLGAFPANYDLRFGIPGPITIQSADANGARPRMGGKLGAPSGGYGIDGKGFFNLAGGDVTFRGLDVSWVNGQGAPDGDNSHGVSAIRKNSGFVGDLVVQNCFIHDNNNGVEAGDGAICTSFDKNIFGNNGTAYVSSGATHNLYMGGHTFTTLTNNLLIAMVNGHCAKTRAKGGLITGNRFYDGTRGSASCQLEIPNGGQYTIASNDFHKGPNAQNARCVSLMAEGPVNDANGGTSGRINRFLLNSNRFSIQVSSGHRFGPGAAVGYYDYVSGVDGQLPHVILGGNSFYLAADCVKFIATHSDYSSVVPVVTETGSVALPAPFALDYSDPGTATPPAARLGYFNYLYDNTGSEYPILQGQIDTGLDDIRIPVGTASGVAIATLVASGDNLYKNDSPTDPRINPYATGAVWSLSFNPPFFGDASAYAPAGRYMITSAGVLKAGAGLVAGTDVVQVRCTSANGTYKTDWRIPIGVIA